MSAHARISPLAPVSGLLDPASPRLCIMATHHSGPTMHRGYPASSPVPEFPRDVHTDPGPWYAGLLLQSLRQVQAYLSFRPGPLFSSGSEDDNKPTCHHALLPVLCRAKAEVEAAMREHQRWVSSWRECFRAIDANLAGPIGHPAVLQV